MTIHQVLAIGEPDEGRAVDEIEKRKIILVKLETPTKDI